jgi:hypothetical protein
MQRCNDGGPLPRFVSSFHFIPARLGCVECNATKAGGGHRFIVSSFPWNPDRFSGIQVVSVKSRPFGVGETMKRWNDGCRRGALAGLGPARVPD